ncbi:MAG: hypothetical protein IPG96_17380 [Proteobacteria bacterium]|nr:hypothetical protein [Pseudomonadota bacterium]
MAPSGVGGRTAAASSGRARLVRRAVNPQQVTALGSNVGDITGGVWHTCARKKSDGKVWCWGGNADDQLGVGPIGTMSRVPLEVTAVTCD